MSNVNAELERISLLENLGYGEDLIESINEAIENDDKSVFGVFNSADEAISAILGDSDVKEEN